MCDHDVVHHLGYEMCDICGEMLSLILEETNRYHPIGEPFNKKKYTHTTKLNFLLNRLIMHSSLPPHKVFKYLYGKVNNIQDIRRELKNSKFKSKYYEFI